MVAQLLRHNKRAKEVKCITLNFCRSRKTRVGAGERRIYSQIQCSQISTMAAAILERVSLLKMSG